MPLWPPGKVVPFFAHSGVADGYCNEEARRDLFGLIERVNLDHTEVGSMPKRGPNHAVLMSKDVHDSLVETSYLLRSPENAQRRLGSLESAREGTVSMRGLVDV